MTELEKMLKDTLTAMEQDLTAHPAEPGQQPVQPATHAGEPRQGHPAVGGRHRAASDRARGISAALATLERYTRELGTALVAFERYLERQIERAREQRRETEQQHSRGPRLGR